MEFSNLCHGWMTDIIWHFMFFTKLTLKIIFVIYMCLENKILLISKINSVVVKMSLLMLVITMSSSDFL